MRTITAAFLATQQHAPHSQHRAPQAITNLTIAHHNIRGLKNHTTDLITFLQETKPDIMTFNETFLRTRDKMFFSGYQSMARADRLNRHGGGVAILVRKGINFDVVNPIPTSGATSNEQLTITIQTTTGTLHISTLYCPKEGKGGPQEKSLRGSVWGGTTSYLQVNSKHERFGNKSRTPGGNLLQETIVDMNLTLINDGTPSYACDSTNDKDILDLMFISPPIIPHFRDFWVGEDLGSDHNTIIGVFSHTPLIDELPPQTVILYHKADRKDIN